MRTLQRVVAGLAVILTTSCTLEIMGSRSEDRLHSGGVHVTLDIEPGVLIRPGTAVATLTYTNTASSPVHMTSAWGCLSFAAVYRGSTRVPFPSTEYGCTAAITPFTVNPGEPLRMEWPLTFGGATGDDAPAGTYRFVARLNTQADSLVHEFEVR